MEGTKFVNVMKLQKKTQAKASASSRGVPAHVDGEERLLKSGRANWWLTRNTWRWGKQRNDEPTTETPGENYPWCIFLIVIVVFQKERKSWYLCISLEGFLPVTALKSSNTFPCFISEIGHDRKWYMRIKLQLKGVFFPRSSKVI